MGGGEARLFRTVAWGEVVEGVDDVVDVVGDREQEVLVAAGGHELLQQGIDGHLLGPVVLAKENHGAGKAH